MKNKPNPGDKLNSWKEIADYLGYTERTCSRRERELGMPVYRYESQKKGRVYAYRSELDEWRKNKSHQKKHTKQIQRPSLRYFVPISSVLLIATILIVLPKSSAESVASFRIESQFFVALAKDRTEIWRNDTKTPNLVSTDIYQARSQTRTKTIDEHKLEWRELPHIIIDDIDQDGGKETLLSIQTRDDKGEGLLYCWNALGDELWKFDVAAPTRYGSELLSPDFRIEGFEVFDINRDGKKEIVVIGIHVNQPPCRVCLLDSGGHLLGEYWHAGFLNDMIVSDLGNDGSWELILGGTNDEFRDACIIVFDANDIHGSSPHLDPKYSIESALPGSEKVYIRFPRSEIISPEEKETILSIESRSNESIEFTTSVDAIIYTFNNDFKLITTTLSDFFLNRFFRSAGRAISNKRNYRDYLTRRVSIFSREQKAFVPLPAVGLFPISSK